MGIDALVHSQRSRQAIVESIPLDSFQFITPSLRLRGGNSWDWEEITIVPIPLLLRL